MCDRGFFETDPTPEDFREYEESQGFYDEDYCGGLINGVEKDRDNKKDDE